MKTSVHCAIVAVLPASLCFGIACDKSAVPDAAGGLRVVLETDMAMPKDIDHVRLEVIQDNKSLLEIDRDVGSGALLMPAAFQVKSTGDPAPVTIRGMAYQGGEVRVERTAVTPFPQDRVGLLRLSLNYLCVGQAETNAKGNVVSTCPDGRTCVQGSCETSKVPASAVPTYGGHGSETDGGTTAATGTQATGSEGCFDVPACFASATAAMADDDCSVALPPGATDERLNVALKFPNGGPGVCSDVACWIVLTGWKLADDRMKLPEAACTKARKEGATLAVTTACAAAPEPLNSCGTWSSAPSRAVSPPVSSPVAESCTGPTNQACGLCGTQSRVCMNGVWSSLGPCMGERECMPSATRDCPGGGSATCSDTCAWEPCGCPSGQSSCAGACRSLDTDVEHCGECGNDCESLAHVSGPVKCKAGQCVLSTESCADGYDDCDGAVKNGCETSLSTAMHCGNCESSCSAPAHATPTCAKGVCGFSCNAGYAECAPGACTNVTSDDANCGECDNVCPSGSTCKSDECACDGEASRPCGDRCGTQTRTCNRGVWSDWSTCSNEGACVPGMTQSCNSAGTQTCGDGCQWGVCGCKAGFTLCGNRCVDAQLDDDNCGKCGVVCGANTFCSKGKCDCYGGNCPVTLASNVGTVAKLVSDGANVYFTTHSTYLSNGTTALDGTIMKLSVNGGTPAALATGLANPVGIATDGKNVYAVLAPQGAGANAGSIIRVPVGGGTSTPLATGLPYPWEIALDSTSIYFGGGSVYKIPLAGGTYTFLANGSFIGGMALSGGNVYWSTFTGTTSQGQPDPEKSVIRSVAVTGGSATTISSDVHQSTTVAADANGVFFARRANPDDQIVRAPLAGGAAVPIGGGTFVQNLVTDGKFVYFTTGGCTIASGTHSSSLAGRIVRTPSDSIPPATGELEQVAIAGGFQGPRQLTVDQTHVYWLNVPCSGSPSIMKVHK